MNTKTVKNRISEYLRNACIVSSFLILLGTLNLNAQTKGFIFETALGTGAAVLDPNGDGFVSLNTAGFINNDNTESEIPYVAFVFLVCF
jgi:hypothetical protein